MKLEEHKSLKPYNTFGIDAIARYFGEATDIVSLSEYTQSDVFAKGNMILGGGSNLLFTKDFDGLVLKNSILGINVIAEDEEHVWVESMAGENWHEFVLFCIKNGWAGIENLSLIPGQVGASPMQNIGAYGVEIKDVFHKLTAWNIATSSIETFNAEDCQFGYRESVFKKELKGKYIILSVTFKLAKQAKLNTNYGAIAETLEKRGIQNPSIKDVSDAVVAIRSSKLPNPAEIGNAGSFFKNPVVPKLLFESIQSKHETMPFYPVSESEVKIPAGWLIEQSGWKGYRKDDFGVHKNQALVLVNYGNAKGAEILDLSKEITTDVFQKFGVQLETEVNII